MRIHPLPDLPRTPFLFSPGPWNLSTTYKHPVSQGSLQEEPPSGIPGHSCFFPPPPVPHGTHCTWGLGPTQVYILQRAMRAAARGWAVPSQPAGASLLSQNEPHSLTTARVQGWGTAQGPAQGFTGLLGPDWASALLRPP